LKNAQTSTPKPGRDAILADGECAGKNIMDIITSGETAALTPTTTKIE
jgi:hypothetical protein